MRISDWSSDVCSSDLNTAPAAAVTAHFVAEEFGPDALVFLKTAEHATGNQAAFEGAVKSAVDVASQGDIVTFGITPTRPETGFGYLKVKPDSRLGTSRAQEVDSFVEKPTVDRAQQFIEQGDHYWNSGMFMFRSGRFLAELRRLEPETYLRSLEALPHAKRQGDTFPLDGTARKETGTPPGTERGKTDV